VSNTIVETHPNVLSAPPVIGDRIVKHAGEHLSKIEKLWLALEKRRVAKGLYTESNKDLCRRFIQKIFNEGELSSIRDFMSPDAVNHELIDSFGDSEPPQGHNIKWLVDLVYLYRHAFPDLHLEVEDQIAEGDRVVTCLHMQGTQKNALMAIPASGRKIDVTGIRVDLIIDGKIIESWAHFDALGMLRQLDALPALNRDPRKAEPIPHETAPGARLPFTGWNPAPGLPQPAR
jgi:predicted ester cyclase